MPKASDATRLLKAVESVMREDRWREAITLLRENNSVLEKHWRLLWNLGWCYFKLQRMDQAQKYLTRATRLAPKSHICKWGLGQVYLKKKQYKRAEVVLSEALKIKEGNLTRTGLALAYLAQGKIEDAENMHIENIKLKPQKSERYESYAAFLSDVGRDAEAEQMCRKAKELRRIN